MQTIVATQRTEVLLLEMKHFERLLLKRHPSTIEAMKSSLELKLQARHSQLLIRHVPLLTSLLEMARNFNAQLKHKSQVRITDQTKTTKDGKLSKKNSDKFDSFIPSRGALVDIYGHGTVFHRIREREKNVRKKKPTNSNGVRTTDGAPATDHVVYNQERPQTSRSPASSESGLFPHPGSGLVYRQKESDPGLTDLENRMRDWLNKDFKSIGCHNSTQSATAAAVVKILQI